MATKCSGDFSKRKNYNSTHIRRKKPARKLSKAENVIYVNSKSHVKAFFSKCEKLISKDFEEIVLYCMGASISKGICLALELCEKYPVYQINANTFTSEVTDDLEPTVDDADYEVNKRSKSALRIKISKTNLLKTKEAT
ncbi:ribonuclease P protein subunit p20-like isoform X1 [Coccinella septempunctata]|uniref:ribonuclease P protein subunit p20-like isoform X1 n=1 Tax=Coccinella septempunctata TaxID=41139 RepID=UPI001D06A56E|nr:ribonuclease P protein subunit p20-like isoform X1 [Coccinella septempunctata]